ncbi:MAG: ATP-dependent DNA helicase RecG [Candidatus Saccharimonadales bacterium]|jgi:ATP-dependent DNA helicase RecG
MNASDNVTRVNGVGPAVAAKFSKLGIETVGDLVNSVPRRFEDYSKVSTVAAILPGPVTIQVKIGAIKARYSRKGLHMTEALATDQSGAVKLVWFNQPYRAKSLKADEEYFVSGEFASNYKFFAITNPACELVSNFPVNTARLVPLYKLTKGLGSAQVRKSVKNALDSYEPTETLPTWLLESEDLMPKSSALVEMHFPQSMEALDLAKRRLGFEEVFELTLASELNKQLYKEKHSLEVPFNKDLVQEFVSKLPFKLTDAQRTVAWQIFQDMAEGTPMNRLVEGDVGSGKTVVAVLSAIGAMNSGLQVAFMAPTELLANQHAASIHKLLESIDMHQCITLLTGSMSKLQKDAATESISSGDAQLVIGTHALFQDNVTFKELGLVIVDEQHRFGVGQRKKLQGKSKMLPHILSMTATPIPRSLALTLYGEMDVSVIDEMPVGRKPVTTEIFIPENREKVYREVRIEVEEGRQAFVVCPQIEEDEEGRLSVVKIHDQLSKKWLKGLSVELLHGRMKADEKDEVMSRFTKGDIDVLVATTVIEVGVDVPNASVMVIEGVDRFGLAQIHQLRGRVGRGSDNSFCYLVLEENKEPSARVKLLEHENNGFKLADYDLELRGPGAIYGTMQHGALDLRVAKLSDVELINSAKNAAKHFIQKGEKLVEYPQLKARVDVLRSITNLN